MRKHVIGLCLTLSIYAAPAVCQSRVSMRIAGPPVQPSFSHHGFGHAVLAGFPYWADYVPASNTIPSVIVVQAPAPPAENAATKIEERKSSAPLMIEWQGDRYVRRSSTSENSRANQPDYMAEGKPFASKIEKAASGRFASKRTPQALPATSDREGQSSDRSRPSPTPTTFIFRDGHREQSADYSIISGVIYARGDYWTTGQWSNQIRISELDLPATIRANEIEGVRFRLPASPNEIITRP